MLLSDCVILTPLGHRDLLLLQALDNLENIVVNRKRGDVIIF